MLHNYIANIKFLSSPLGVGVHTIHFAKNVAKITKLRFINTYQENTVLYS